MNNKSIIITGIAILAIILWLFGSIPGSNHIPPDLSNITFLRGVLLDYLKDKKVYPEGKTSTEVFQTLLNQNYISLDQIRLLYYPMPGKIPGQTLILKSENVCYDTTFGISVSTPDWIPLVFSTGYAIDYKTGYASVLPGNTSQGIAVAYKSHYQYWPLDGKRSIFVMPGFDKNENLIIYRQLLP